MNNEYTIKWNPGQPETGAEIEGIEYPKREVVSAVPNPDGTLLVLHAKPRTCYRGKGQPVGYVGARFEVFKVTSQPDNTWKGAKLVEFGARGWTKATA